MWHQPKQLAQPPAEPFLTSTDIKPSPRRLGLISADSWRVSSDSTSRQSKHWSFLAWSFFLEAGFSEGWFGVSLVSMLNLVVVWQQTLPLSMMTEKWCFMDVRPPSWPFVSGKLLRSIICFAYFSTSTERADPPHVFYSVGNVGHEDGAALILLHE